MAGANGSRERRDSFGNQQDTACYRFLEEEPMKPYTGTLGSSAARVVFLCLLLALAACKQKLPAPPPPPPPPPNAASIAQPSEPRAIEAPSIRFWSEAEGAESRVGWIVQRADIVVISPDVGVVPPEGKRVVVPDSDTAYLLVATGRGGTRSASAIVMRRSPARTPNKVSVSTGDTKEFDSSDSRAMRVVILGARNRETSRPHARVPSGRTLDEAFRGLRIAGFAFESPPEVAEGEVARSRLLIDPEPIFAADSDEFRRLASAPGNVAGKETKISHVMEALLSATDGLRVIPKDDPRREISAERPTEWFWELEGKALGDASLTLSLKALLVVAGERRMESVPGFPVHRRVTIVPPRKREPPPSDPSPPVSSPQNASLAPASGLPFASQLLIAGLMTAALGTARYLSRHRRARTSGSSENHTLEIGHVLFVDIVGYSRLPIDHQTETLMLLQEIVSNTQEFVRASSSDRLISLPTGDGMALVFFEDALAPVQCAVAIANALTDHPEVELRMGLNTGPVYRVFDINESSNVAGPGINIAQRVMDCGDAGHILMSEATAEVIRQLSGWASAIHAIGEREVKHGVRIRLFNLVVGQAGNPRPPAKGKSGT